jgi:small subunit ribosomal protein S1
MLSAKWKQGASSAARTEPARTGQVRTFRIVKIDAASKKIELELAG